MSSVTQSGWGTERELSMIIICAQEREEVIRVRGYQRNNGVSQVPRQGASRGLFKYLSRSGMYLVKHRSPTWNARSLSKIKQKPPDQRDRGTYGKCKYLHHITDSVRPSKTISNIM
jgi:hypothetical protein